MPQKFKPKKLSKFSTVLLVAAALVFAGVGAYWLKKSEAEIKFPLGIPNCPEPYYSDPSLALPKPKSPGFYTFVDSTASSIVNRWTKNYSEDYLLIQEVYRNGSNVTDRQFFYESDNGKYAAHEDTGLSSSTSYTYKMRYRAVCEDKNGSVKNRYSDFTPEITSTTLSPQQQVNSQQVQESITDRLNLLQ